MTRFGTKSKLVAAALGGALALSACSGGGSSSDDDETQDPTTASGPSGTIYVANDQEYDSYNDTTASTNSYKNSMVNKWVTTGFWYFGADGSIVRNEEFGTFEKVSDDPLTVEYTIAEEATWSDGDPIACDDALLWWAQNSGNMAVEREVDVLDPETGEPTGEKEVQETPVFSVVGTDGVEDVTTPVCEDPAAKTFTLVYDKPFADWESNGPSNGYPMMPAHIVAEQGGFADSAEMSQAILDGDAEGLKAAGDFFNEGWLFQGAMPDAALMPSSGPFTITNFAPGESISIGVNEEYWGTPPGAAEIVFRVVPGTEQPQALENGDVNVIQPQPDADIKDQLANMEGVTLVEFDQFVYEHLDLNFDSGSLADDPRLREAFALCVPRQQIVERLIQPIAAEAQPQDVRTISPFQAEYAESVEYAFPAEYAEPDIEAARALLEEADAVGTVIRGGAIADNKRREDTWQLIKESCDQAGFDVQPYFEANFFDPDGGLSQNTYDVALFAWLGSPQVSGWASTFTTPTECSAEGKGNNNGCYSNPEVDDLIAEINETVDPAAQLPLINEVEKILWEDVATIPLFAHPGLLAFSDSVKGVEANATQDNFAASMHKWTVEE
ncbi:ABC transporter family substrate-binding protein [Streptomyces aidingensis]|uniref:Peptide/nickel transport system substrate-binding protein n=1 Tax=Streptomyces aidingensis TaxID=910347 RepID=A0A1I1QDU6_9ACTN|nr:ABC transporter family substrate-binding protein [Streptomyces aidingensis]SFD16310.1 peptide/nickel transport system substrate-binding protein [Streptomyces aidingensis]